MDTKPKEKKKAKPRVPWFVTLRNHLLAGLFVLVPITLTIWIVSKAFFWIDSFFTQIFKDQFNLAIPPYGSGFLAIILIIAFVGMLTRNFIGRKFLQIFEKIFSGIPIINRIYLALQQVSQALLGKNRNIFQKVIVFEYPLKGTYSIGFVTSDTKTTIQDKLGESEIYHVFVPTTPNPTSGFLLFIPKIKTHELDLTVEDAMKLIVSGGVMIPDQLLPGFSENQVSQNQKKEIK